MGSEEEETGAAGGAESGAFRRWRAPAARDASARRSIIVVEASSSRLLSDSFATRYTPAHTHTHAHTHTQARTHAQAHTHAHTHTRTHTYAHTLLCVRWSRGSLGCCCCLDNAAPLLVALASDLAADAFPSRSATEAPSLDEATLPRLARGAVCGRCARCPGPSQSTLRSVKRAVVGVPPTTRSLRCAPTGERARARERRMNIVDRTYTC